MKTARFLGGKRKSKSKKGGRSYRRKSRRIARRTARRVARRRGGASTYTLGAKKPADEQKHILHLFNTARKAPDDVKDEHISNLRTAIDGSSAPDDMKDELHEHANMLDLTADEKEEVKSFAEQEIEDNDDLSESEKNKAKKMISNYNNWFSINYNSGAAAGAASMALGAAMMAVAKGHMN